MARRLALAAFWPLLTVALLSTKGTEQAMPAPSAQESGEQVLVCKDGPLTAHVRLGKRQRLLQDRAFGDEFRWFPDGAIAVLQTSPRLRLLMSVSISTYLVEGRDMSSLTAATRVLGPGEPGSFDNGYAGVSSAYRCPDTGELLAIYHAEDQEKMGHFPSGTPGFYCSVCLAVSEDNGRTLRKAGPIITSALPKDPQGMRDQGAGEACIVPDRQGRHLYCYYVEHSRAEGRGVQIFMARSRLEDRARPGSWFKLCQGAFSQPGLGGKETPVVSAQDHGADACFPHVTFSRLLNRYVMVFNINGYREIMERRPPQLSGTYLAFSEDGLRWSEPRQLLKAYALPVRGSEYAWHPTIVWDDPHAESAAGWLCYAYNPDGGPHFLVGHRIAFEVRKQ